MRTQTFILSLIFLFLFSGVNATLKINFILYDGLSDSITTPIEQKLLDNVERICKDLGATQPTSYTIRIWGNNSSYLAYQTKLFGTNYPGSSGYVMGAGEMGILNVSGLPDVAEHEFAHSMSLRINSSFANNPRWLWEAVAIYESGEFKDPTKFSYLKNGDYPTIAELDEGFNTSTYQIYDVGYLITEFILNKWGSDKLNQLIKKNGNLQSVLGISTTEFGSQWEQFVKQKYFSTSSSVINQNKIHIYPNPASNYITISGIEMKNLEFIILDENGQSILSGESINGIIDIKMLRNGAYILQLNCNDEKHTISFLKR
jgi:hypothetical protein